jgi:hypothetical protein
LPPLDMSLEASLSRSRAIGVPLLSFALAAEVLSRGPDCICSSGVAAMRGPGWVALEHESDSPADRDCRT